VAPISSLVNAQYNVAPEKFIPAFGYLRDKRQEKSKLENEDDSRVLYGENSRFSKKDAYKFNEKPQL
jgi:hypothetical protein